MTKAHCVLFGHMESTGAALIPPGYMLIVAISPSSLLTAELWDTAKLPEPPTFCADKGIVSDSLLYDVLVSVARHGIARLRDLPTDLELVEDFALRIGAIRETHFDRIFDVISKADGDSNAYTTGYLAAHTDIPTREAPPGIQVLHARIADAQGGESLMTDGFKVAQDIEQEFPEQYKTLTTQQNGVMQTAQVPKTTAGRRQPLV